jgi:hypothetical protein
MFKRLLLAALCLWTAPAHAQFNGTNGIFALNSMSFGIMSGPGAAPTIVNGGSGHAVNDVLTLDCPNTNTFVPASNRPTVTVTGTGAGGAVTALSVLSTGFAQSIPSSGLAGVPNGQCLLLETATTGIGVGAQINVIFGFIGAYAQQVNFNNFFGVAPVVNGGTGLTALGTGVQTGFATNLNAPGGFVGVSALGANVFTALQVAVGTPGAPVINGGAGGTPSSLVLTNATSLPIGSITGFGTGVEAALTVNIGSAGAPVLLNGAGGTPSAINLTNGTALPHGSITGLGTNVNTGLGNATNSASGFPQLNASAQLPVTPVLGITGATNACTGCIGEVFTSDIPVGGAVNQPTSGTAITITSFNLTAGDWDCWGMVSDNPAGTTTISQMTGAISTVAATIPGTFAQTSINGLSVPAGAKIQVGAFRSRENISSTTTIYLVGSTVFAVSTQNLWGHLECRREQ